MRRIKMVLAVAAAMAVMVTAAVAPAFADNNKNNNNDRHLDQRDMSLDHRLLNQNDNCCFNNDFDNGFLFDDSLGFNDFNNGCFDFPFCDNFNNFDSSTHGASSGSTVNITPPLT